MTQTKQTRTHSSSQWWPRNQSTVASSGEKLWAHYWPIRTQ